MKNFYRDGGLVISVSALVIALVIMQGYIYTRDINIFWLSAPFVVLIGGFASVNVTESHRYHYRADDYRPNDLRRTEIRREKPACAEFHRHDRHSRKEFGQIHEYFVFKYRSVHFINRRLFLMSELYHRRDKMSNGNFFKIY